MSAHPIVSGSLPLYQGRHLRLTHLTEPEAARVGGLVELCFDRAGEAINKLDAHTVREFGEATAVLAAAAGQGRVRGVLVTSAKSAFIVGADILEFGALFKLPQADLVAAVAASCRVFTAFEDLPVPSVVALQGFALGGGLEMALCGALRVLGSQAQVGLPEVKLGLFPGFGGTVRLPRVAGAQVAIDWITGGQPASAQAALEAGVADAVAAPEALRDEAIDLLCRAAAGHLDWRARQACKRRPLPWTAEQASQVFDAARAQVARRSGRHQPAALAAVALMQQATPLDGAAAQTQETLAFAEVAKTQAATAMVRTFLSDQVLKKLLKQHAGHARPVHRAAVLGAGIMGGGIAYTSARHGTPVCLKDIAQAPLDLGLGEARKQLGKLVKTGRLAPDRADAVLASITPQQDYQGFEKVGLVIEAVVERLALKHAVLSELEGVVAADCVIASNTSSLRIDDIARPLARPQNFVGMHFFNPVPVMPLVEIIKGRHTSDVAVSTAVRHAVAMGKTPIVVQDCPGFLVNRILTAYMRGFLQLVVDGADFEQVDQVMEAFGWPMGPAYLEDVVGIDTGSHVSDVISAGYPQRMPPLELDALRLMAAEGRFGQKNGLGFYRYETDPQGKPRRSAAPDTHALLARLQPQGTRPFSEQDIVDRMMLPLLIEAAHALEDGVVASAAELDMALLLGIGFPAYLGGALTYADWLGLAEVNARAARHAALGPAYEPTARMREMAAAGQRYHGG